MEHLIAENALRAGAPVELVHERDNPHDRNAVAIFVQGTKIGYIGRIRSAKYATIVDENRCYRVTVGKVDMISKPIWISIKIMYRDLQEISAASCVPDATGVYRLSVSRNGTEYIGSAENLRERFKRHAYDLRAGSHHNHSLQDEYDKTGGALEFIVIKICKSIEEARLLEEAEIDRRLVWGASLHNSTPDGQGRRPRRGGVLRSRLSERYALLPGRQLDAALPTVHTELLSPQPPGRSKTIKFYIFALLVFITICLVTRLLQ